MSKDERLGDKFPAHHNVKWGAMKAGESHLSEEWHDVKSGESPTTDKWDDMTPSKGHMSERYVEMEAGHAPDSDKWHEMKQEKRMDPYAMHSSDGERETPFKPMAKEKADNKVERPNQHTEFGTTREI